MSIRKHYEQFAISLMKISETPYKIIHKEKVLIILIIASLFCVSQSNIANLSSFANNI